MPMGWKTKNRGKLNRPLGLLAFLHGQLGDAVDPIDALVIHSGKRRAQQVMDEPIAEPSPRLGDVDDRGTQCRGLRI